VELKDFFFRSVVCSLSCLIKSYSNLITKSLILKDAGCAE